MISIANNGSSEIDKKSRFNFGIQAFEKILNLFNRITLIGFKARRKFREKDIVDYLGIIRTAYIPLSPVLIEEDKEFIEKEIKELRESIDIYNRKVKGNKIEIVDRLTELEKRFYNSIQNINMYIQLKSDYTRVSKKRDLLEHLEGSEIPELDEDIEQFLD